MIKREEVEALLVRAELAHPGFISIKAADIAELASGWLALMNKLDAAPIADPAEDYNPCSPSSLMWAATLAGYYKGQRVRLVPEANSGGDRG